jgi:GeoRSP system SPASM domain protein
MSLDLLDTPVRLTWDLHGPVPSLDRGALRAIADAMVAGGVFFVTLEERPLLHPEIAGLVGQLQGGGCRLSLVCTGGDAELANLARLAPPLPDVQLDAAAFLSGGVLDESRLLTVLAKIRRCGVEPGLRLTPLRENLSIIPRLLSFCREAGVTRFKLPNARIGDTFQSIPPADLPRCSDLAVFREDWLRNPPGVPESLQVEIHDRFLWEIMIPGDEQARSEYGGCQAGNSLGHVDARGTVYACAAWPEPLGSLPGASLEEIWQAPRRLAVRRRITQVPPGCHGCRDYPLCLGGCRGLGEVLGGDGGGRDLMCRGPRP